MRLTLRTLLAYLDHTLEQQDAEALKAKIDESGFATQLVARIRGALESDTLAAWSPDAAGPIHDANVISEYLDSTLTPQQVAEIERACLESDTELAEVASCHQILTRALGKPAEVPPNLRRRIHQLPSQMPPAAGGDEEMSSLAGAPAVERAVDATAVAGPTEVGEIPESHADLAVPPLGPDDSGVSDAPTRIREAATSGSADVGVALAGSRARRVATDFYGGSIRPSRITPWLVSLALAAALLFVLAQIFSPLLEQPTVENGDTDVKQPAPESAPVIPGPDTDDTVDPSVSQQPAEPPAEPDEPAEPAEPDADVDADTETAADAAVDAESQPSRTRSETDSETPPRSSAADQDPGAASELDAPPETQESPETPQLDAELDSDPAVDSDRSAITPPVPEGLIAETDEGVESAGGKTTAPQPPPPLAKLVGNNALVMTRPDQQPWQRLVEGEPVEAGTTLIAAPLYRAALETASGIDLTLIGPVQLELARSETGGNSVALDYGRLVLRASQPDSEMELVLGGHPIHLVLPEAESVVAIRAEPIRAPGTDPFDPANHQVAMQVLVSQGVAEIQPSAAPEPSAETAFGEPPSESDDSSQGLTLETNQQWLWRDLTDSNVAALESVPQWIDETGSEDSSIETSAREGLLALINEPQPLEMSLREAIQFRRVEVGALAGRTLLLLGRGDVYFGGDGILNQPRQKTYWTEHYWSLMRRVDLSVESANALREKIALMEAADGKALFRLLVGFSQQQLEAGADQQLVQWLDSPSMAVRVLALENLRRITGTTLYFKPQEENPIRRTSDVKKWEVRLRKGDIRWPDEPPDPGDEENPLTEESAEPDARDI